MTLAWFCCPRCRVMFQGNAGARLARCPACATALGTEGGPADPPEWYYARNKQKVGPVSRSKLQQLAASGQLGPTDMVLREGSGRWAPARSVAGLFPDATVTYRPASAPVQTTSPEVPPLSTSRPAPSARADQPTVAGYKIMEVLGRGGMGVVYKARQAKLKRLVALKMILAGGHAGPQELDRFRLEAEAVARLQHPNIVQIYEVGEWQAGEAGTPMPYFSLEFVDGGSLAKKLAGNPLPPREAAKLAAALARAMQAAHERGIVHRDLKPANVLLTADGTPKIADFGLAKQLGDDSGQTRTGAIMGTPSYMAPEQAAGQTKTIGPAVDVYALGAILYECLTGRPPFKAATVLETLELVRSQDPVPPTSLQPKTPRDLETICLKCLEKTPARRYATAKDLADDLDRFLSDKPITARPASLAYRFGKFAVRHKALVGGVAATFLMLVVAITGTTAGMVKAQGAAREADEARGKAEDERNQVKEKTAQLLVSEGRRKMRDGEWQAALNNFEQALEAGYPDEVELRVAMLDCHAYLNRMDKLEADLDALSGREDLGRHRGPVLFARARFALTRKKGKDDAIDLIRQALAAGLEPADKEFAEGLLAPTAPEVVRHLEAAVAKGRFDPGILDVLVPVLMMLGRFEDARDHIIRMEEKTPNNPTLLHQGAIIYALQGDIDRANRRLDRLKEITGKDLSPDHKLTEALARAGRGDFQWEDNPQAVLTRELLAAALRGGTRLDESAGMLGVGNVQMGQLPFIKELTRVMTGFVTAQASGKPEAVTEAFAAIARVQPDGLILCQYGQALHEAGKLEEAEKVLTAALATPSMLNMKQRIRCHLSNVRWARQRASGRPLTPEQKRQFAAQLRQIVQMGPLPPAAADDIALGLMTVGEYAPALAVIEERQRREPLDVQMLHVRAMIEFELAAFPRTLATCNEILKRKPTDKVALDLLRLAREAIKKVQANAGGAL